MNARVSFRRGLSAALLLLTLLGSGRAALAAEFSNNIVTASLFPGTLQQAVDAAGPQGMLIVDQAYTLDEPLVLPRLFRLVGMGPQGRGSLHFTMTSGSAIRIAPAGDAYVTIESLDIEGDYQPGNGVATTARGLDLTGSHVVFLRDVVIRGFDVGVYGNQSFSLHSRDSNVSVNRSYNYHLTNESNSWRITGGLSSFAGRAAIRIQASNNTLVDAVRMESNPFGVYTDTLGTHISHNRFECNPVLCPNGGVAVRIGPTGAGTTLVDNLYSGVTPLEDLSLLSSTYRFDNGFGAQVRPQPNEDGLRVDLPLEAGQLIFDRQGRLRLGPEQGSSARFTLNGPAGEEAFRVRVDGVTQAVIDSQGQAGFGTALPAAQLHVQAGAGENALLVGRAGAATDLLVDPSGHVAVGAPSGALAKLTVNAETGQDPLRLRVGNITRLMVSSAGRLGVGTSVPAERLHVVGNLRLDGNLVTTGEICIGSGC